jgi:hypothetical protein
MNRVSSIPRIPVETLQPIKTRRGQLDKVEYAKWLISYHFTRYTYCTA